MKFRVFRHGWNAANNPAAGARPEDCDQLVATVEATDLRAAILAVSTSGVTVYNNQYLWAESEDECLAAEKAAAEKHAGQVLVKYWRGTTPLADWCTTVHEVDGCVDRHSNSYPVEFFDADGSEISYDDAVMIVGSPTDN